MPIRLILASASPRRRELLSLLQMPFDVVPSAVAEDLDDLGPSELAETLARDKALDVWRREPRNMDTIVLGADTVVCANCTGPPALLAKPRDAEEARRMLQLLSGETHTVHTGVCLVRTDGEAPSGYRSRSRVVVTQVAFRALTAEMIDAYLATGEPFDKAGGYGVQGYAAAFVESVTGDYFNIVGLPLQSVACMLEEAGIAWWRGPAALG